MQNNVGDKGAAALAKWEGQELKLGYNSIKTKGAAALAQWNGQLLHLQDNNIGPDGDRYLKLRKKIYIIRSVLGNLLREELLWLIVN